MPTPNTTASIGDIDAISLLQESGLTAQQIADAILKSKESIPGSALSPEQYSILTKLVGVISSASEIDAVVLNKKIIAKLKDGVDIFNTNSSLPKRGSCYSFITGTEYLQFLNDTNITEAQISNKKLVAPISSGVKTATYSSFELDSAPKKNGS